MAILLKRRGKPALPDVFVEIIDAVNKPLLIMPQRVAIRQGLRHKCVLVCLRNAAGHIFLHKRPAASQDPHGGLWGLAASGRVLAGESRQEAAARLLDEELHISYVELLESARIAPSPATGNIQLSLFITAKTSAIPHANEGMFVDKEEFRAILRDFPYMVTPFLHQAMPYLYPQNT